MNTTPDTLRIDLPDHSYPIHIGSGLLGSPDLLADCLPRGPVLIVTNETVAPLYLARVRALLGDRPTNECILPDGEAHKTQQTLTRVYDALAGARMTRDGAVVALGGGVIGDLAGFAAATWNRGIAVAQIPTTLLSQVDSSVGGKTAVNHPAGKNLIGAFHQPAVVIADIDTLSTLPERELRAGVAEVIKYGLIADLEFLCWIETNMERLLGRDPAALSHAIKTSCATKARLVALDERESGPRALLNLGHTFGHAIEAAMGYGTWLHGEAVAAGMVVAAELSAELGWIDATDVRRVRDLIAAAGLPTAAPRLGAESALRLMSLDKKVKDGRIRLVLLRSLGEAVVTADYPAQALTAVLQREMGT